MNSAAYFLGNFLIPCAMLYILCLYISSCLQNLPQYNKEPGHYCAAGAAEAAATAFPNVGTIFRLGSMNARTVSSETFAFAYNRQTRHHQ